MDVLDNPVWESLQGAHAHLAEVAQSGTGSAARYPTAVTVFGAVDDPRNPASWEALAALLDGGVTGVLIDPGDVPDGWDVVAAYPCVQMDGAALGPSVDPSLVTLGDADVEDMLSLVERTQPGPFRRRTVEMGRYLGLRHDGVLIAMAGERLHPAGWTEISAVCTDAAYRGQGLGTRLMRAIAIDVRDRGERPFLHAMTTNTNAIHLYEGLGFVVCSTPTVTVLRRSA